MPPLEAVVSQVVKRQVEFVGKKLGSVSEPGHVADTVHADPSDHLAVAFTLAVVLVLPVFGPDHRVEAVRVGLVQRTCGVK